MDDKLVDFEMDDKEPIATVLLTYAVLQNTTNDHPPTSMSQATSNAMKEQPSHTTNGWFVYTPADGSSINAAINPRPANPASSVPASSSVPLPPPPPPLLPLPSSSSTFPTISS
ncbi:unnamed protein product [Cyclocybe aegerita]|uniref:Uncharacterized protein n=1 Tax=Cyclocybe aegerita TaxID=1973307 RepID=A0A8S0VVT3_CYCAE|nr:unnamed protein product [Cyclocybe aegerita]